MKSVGFPMRRPQYGQQVNRHLIQATVSTHKERYSKYVMLLSQAFLLRHYCRYFQRKASTTVEHRIWRRKLFRIPLGNRMFPKWMSELGALVCAFCPGLGT